MDSKTDRATIAETISTVAWFTMDACWKMDWMIPAYYLALVNIIMMFFCIRGVSAREGVAFGGVMSWLLMNIFWMIGETTPRYSGVSTGFMCIGAVFIVALLVMDGGAQRLLKRFRIR